MRDIRTHASVGDWDNLYPTLAQLAVEVEERGLHLRPNLRPNLRPIAEVDEDIEGEDDNEDDDCDSDGTVVGRSR